MFKIIYFAVFLIGIFAITEGNWFGLGTQTITTTRKIIRPVKPKTVITKEKEILPVPEEVQVVEKKAAEKEIETIEEQVPVDKVTHIHKNVNVPNGYEYPTFPILPNFYNVNNAINAQTILNEAVLRGLVARSQPISYTGAQNLGGPISYPVIVQAPKPVPSVYNHVPVVQHKVVETPVYRHIPIVHHKVVETPIYKPISVVTHHKSVETPVEIQKYIEAPIVVPPVNILPLESIPVPLPIQKDVHVTENTPSNTIRKQAEEPLSTTESSNVLELTENSSASAQTVDLSEMSSATGEISQLPNSYELLPTKDNAKDFAIQTNSVLNSDDESDYSHSYALSDGTKVSEEGYLTKNSDGTNAIVKKGNYEWFDSYGQPIKVNWIADENGYRVVN